MKYIIYLTRLDRASGWIPSSKLREYHSTSDGSCKCACGCGKTLHEFVAVGKINDESAETWRAYSPECWDRLTYEYYCSIDELYNYHSATPVKLA